MTDRQRTGRNSQQRGKAVELDWAHTLGTTRIGPTGLTGPDLITGPWAVEVKSRLGFKALLALMDAAQSKATGLSLTPVLGLTVRAGQGKPSRHLVVMERGDWVDYCVSKEGA